MLIAIRYFDEHDDKPAKAFCEPVMTIAPIPLSTSAASKAWFSSVMSAEQREFKALGRLRVMSSTEGSGREVRI